MSMKECRNVNQGCTDKSKGMIKEMDFDYDQCTAGVNVGTFL